MINLDIICNKVHSAIDGIITVSVVDIKSGEIISISDSENNNDALKNNISSAVMNIFRTSNVAKIEKVISDVKNKDIKDPFKEVFISSSDNFYFFRLLDELEYVMFIISKKTVNQGLIWSEIKRANSEIKTLV